MREALGGEVSETSVSPTFGGQVREQALQAVAAAMLIIVAFISVRFEFAFALAAMVALLHDILMTVGFYAIVGREVTLVTVVAVLTVLGYSLYDTIIIFDRIRENTPRVGYNRRRFDQTINDSIRQVVRRSIYTSLCTLIPITALLIFGETTLADFAFALLVGILAGTYSSIFIASPVLSPLQGVARREAPACAVGLDLFEASVERVVQRPRARTASADHGRRPTSISCRPATLVAPSRYHVELHEKYTSSPGGKLCAER